MGYLIFFFIRDGINSRRALWITVLGMVPVALSLVLLGFRPLLSQEELSLSFIYPQFSYFLFLHFLLPLTAVFIGTAVIGDEVEERTLPYLLTRPIPRWSIVTAKAIAGIITIGTVIFISLALTFIIMNSGAGMGRILRALPDFFRSCVAIFLGLLVYVPLFGLFGGLLKRPVLAGLLFTFGWESSVAWFPGNVRLLTVVHFLHSLFPSVRRINPNNFGSSLFGLAISINKTSPVAAVIVLLLLSIIFTALMILLLYRKEYRLDQGA